MAEVLKLEEVEGSLAVGAGGSFETRIVRLPRLVLLKGSKAFCTFRGITVHVPCGEGRIPYCVLGRDYVFRRFTVIFRERDARVTLRGPCHFSQW